VHRDDSPPTFDGAASSVSNRELKRRGTARRDPGSLANPNGTPKVIIELPDTDQNATTE
jgi:hypothetical protein